MMAAAQIARAESGAPAARGGERELLLRHREGDPDAFAALVEEYRAPVYSYLIRCGVDAGDRDDLFQEVFIRVHRAAASYQAHRPVHPWLFTIVANAVRSHLRRRRVRQLLFADPRSGNPSSGNPPYAEPADAAPSSERRAAARETLAFVEGEIRKLPPAQREVVLLAAVEKLALKEVAAVLEIPVNTVKTHLRRARLRLAQALARNNAGGVP